MADVVFPPNVEQFIGLTNEFLAHFKLSMVLRDQIPESQSRIYEVEAQDGLVQVTVHRTSWSFQAPVGEYRVRVSAKVPADFANFFRGKEIVANRAATLGAFVSDAVVCQCLVPGQFQRTVAGFLAAAIVHAKRSIIVSAAAAHSKDQSSSVQQLSARTDLDFEKVHYDYAHLGIGSVGPRCWALSLMDSGVLAMDAVYNNPYWGGGFCAYFA